MALAAVSLDDKYTLEQGRVFLSGTQALVRLPMMQRRRDEAAGLNTAGEDAQLALEQAGVLQSLDNLATFPFVQEAIRDRGLRLIGGHFGIRTGKLSLYDPATNAFAEVPE